MVGLGEVVVAEDETDDGLLFGKYLLEVVRVDVLLHDGGHAANDEVEAKQFHHFFVDELLNWGFLSE